jgi:hypothetical protein
LALQLIEEPHLHADPYGGPPDLSRLERFGKLVWVHDADGSKLDPGAGEAARWADGV